MHDADTRTTDRAADAWRRLAGTGARRTLAREAVIGVLAASPVHLTIAEIHHRIGGEHPQVYLSTVHRTVATLVDLGVIHALPWPGEARYGLRTSPHVHALCDACGAMSEISAERMTGTVNHARQDSGLDLPDDGLALFTRCATCRAKQPEPGPA